MTDRMTDNIDPLEPFFDAAKRDVSVPLDTEMAFMKQVLADAQALQPAPVASQDAPAVRARWWQRLSEPFGGLPALSGLALAAVTGVMIGVLNPDVGTAFAQGELVDYALQGSDLEYEMGLYSLFGEN